METVNLPRSMASLCQHLFGDLSTPDNLPSANDPQNFLTPTQNVMWKYCGPALTAGRPLDSCIIMLAGESGSGKSSTINALFEDQLLCPVNQYSSETSEAILVRKQLCVTKESPAIKGYLGFVDVPGTFDTNSENEARNMAKINVFKKNSVELADRVLSKDVLMNTTIRKNVHPNVVLFVVNATDNRLNGPSSSLVKTVKVFNATGDFIDREKNNVVVALTHAMSMSSIDEPLEFVNGYKDKKAIIQNIFRDHLGITGVEVVAIENRPNKYGTQMSKIGDFYQLPDGQLSHYNLFKAINECMARNRDRLGSLLTSWYFASNCPEKNHKAEKIIPRESLSEEEILAAAEVFADINNLPFENARKSITRYNFRRLGRGYCPVTEEIKPVTPLGSLGASAREVTIGDSHFEIPCEVDFQMTNRTNFERLSFLEKEEYEENMQNKYSLGGGVKLVVSASLEGRWLNSSKKTGSASVLSLVQEKHLALFSLVNPRRKERDLEFQADLQNLPDTYDSSTAPSFNLFFSRWGTHMIIEEAVGGSIMLLCSLETFKESWNDANLKEIEGKVETVFKSLFTNVAGEYSYKNHDKGLREVGITNEQVRIEGGNPPLATLESLTPQKVQDWSETIPSNPAVLHSSIKLYPYYNFLQNGEKCNSLLNATRDYLSGNLEMSQTPEDQEFSRNTIADYAVLTVKNFIYYPWPLAMIKTIHDWFFKRR